MEGMPGKIGAKYSAAAYWVKQRTVLPSTTAPGSKFHNPHMARAAGHLGEGHSSLGCFVGLTVAVCCGVSDC